MIVPVATVWQQPGVPLIDVEDIDSLARIAAHYERSILHERAEYGDAFWVCDESGQFRYAVLDPLWEAPALQTGWEAPAEEAGWEPEGAARLPEPEPLDAQGWAPAPGAPPSPAPAPLPADEIAAGDLRRSLPAQTLQFGAASPSAIAHG